MGTKVHEVMSQRPRAVSPDTSVLEVAEVMDQEDVGSVPVLEGDRLAGIVTDRDITVRAVAKGKDPRGMPVREITTRDVVTVGPDDDLADTLKLMASYQVRRIPVVDSEEHLVGVVSQADVALEAKEKAVGQLVEDISRPPQGPRT